MTFLVPALEIGAVAGCLTGIYLWLSGHIPMSIASQPDFTITGGGTLYLLRPVSDAAKEWVQLHIPEDAQWLGDAVAIEHRYIQAIVDGLEADGLVGQLQ